MWRSSFSLLFLSTAVAGRSAIEKRCLTLLGLKGLDEFLEISLCFPEAIPT